jgi:hypothetical protein
MFIWLQAVEHRRDLSFWAYHEGRAVDPHIFLAVHALFLHHAVLGADGLVLVGQQRIREIVLLFELLLGRGLVGGDAEHSRTGPLDFLECVAEPARFNRSTWRVGLGIEEQDQVLAAIILQRDCLSLFIRQRELRGFIINFHGFSVFIRSNEFI